MSDGKSIVAVMRENPVFTQRPEASCKMVSFDNRLDLDEESKDVQEFLYSRLVDVPVEDLLEATVGSNGWPDLTLVYDNGTWEIKGTEDELGNPVRWEGTADNPLKGFWQVFDDFCCYLAEEADERAVISTLMKCTVMKPLFLYDHSGMSISTNDGFPDRGWDVSLIGLAYFEQDQVEELAKQGVSARQIIDADVAMLDDYLQGEVYACEVFDASTGDHTYIGGFYPTADEKLDNGQSFATEIASEYVSDFGAATIEEGDIDDFKAFDMKSFAEEHGIKLNEKTQEKAVSANKTAPMREEERERGPKR